MTNEPKVFQLSPRTPNRKAELENVILKKKILCHLLLLCRSFLRRDPVSPDNPSQPLTWWVLKKTAVCGAHTVLPRRYLFYPSCGIKLMPGTGAII